MNDALPAVTLKTVGVILELLLTEHTGLFMLDSTDGQIEPCVPCWTGADLTAGKALLAPLGLELFKRGDAYFETNKRGF